MDPENQDRIRSVVDKVGAADLMVVVGSTDPEGLTIATQTVTEGDPSFVGPLAGIQLGLPVMHILEDEIKRQVDGSIYRSQVGLVEHAADTEAIRGVMRATRTDG
jgi:glycine/sarcosine/betaine reductase complex component A